MNNQAANQYLRTRILTATPEQLHMMLYDGAVSFCEQARAALVEKNYEQSYNLICRVQKIVLELTCTLKHEVTPEMCSKLAALYNYAYRKLIEANIEHKLESLEDAIHILKYRRETWSLLMEHLGKQKAAVAARTLDLPAPNARMEASISVQG